MGKPRCDYCKAPEVAGRSVRAMQFRIGRLRFVVEWTVRQVCGAHLVEAGAPFSAEDLRRIREELGGEEGC